MTAAIWAREAVCNSGSVAMRRLSEGFGRIANLADDLSDGPSGDRIAAWIVGVGIAALVAAYSLYCIISQHAVFLAGWTSISPASYDGADAVALGVCYLSTACFLHCHFFWSFRERFFGYAQLGKIACLVGGTGGIVYLVVNSLVFG